MLVEEADDLLPEEWPSAPALGLGLLKPLLLLLRLLL